MRGLVLRRGLALTACGVAIGVPAAAAAGRMLESLLFGVTPLDGIAFAAAILLFAAVAGLASYLPARRATAIDPMVVLREH